MVQEVNLVSGAFILWSLSVRIVGATTRCL